MERSLGINAYSDRPVRTATNPIWISTRCARARRSGLHRTNLSLEVRPRRRQVSKFDVVELKPALTLAQHRRFVVANTGQRSPVCVPQFEAGVAER